jgi:hypothetical protein
MSTAPTMPRVGQHVRDHRDDGACQHIRLDGSLRLQQGSLIGRGSLICVFMFWMNGLSL